MSTSENDSFRRSATAPCCSVEHAEEVSWPFEGSVPCALQAPEYVEAVAAVRNPRLPQSPYAVMFSGAENDVARDVALAGVVSSSNKNGSSLTNGHGTPDKTQATTSTSAADAEFEEMMERRNKAISATKQALDDTNNNDDGSDHYTPQRFAQRTSSVTMVDMSTSPKRPNPLREARQRHSPSPPNSPTMEQENLATFYMKKYQEQLDVNEKLRSESTRTANELEAQVQEATHRLAKSKRQFESEMKQREAAWHAERADLSYQNEVMKSTAENTRQLSEELDRLRTRNHTAESEAEQLRALNTSLTSRLQTMKSYHKDLQGQVSILKGETSVPMGGAAKELAETKQKLEETDRRNSELLMRLGTSAKERGEEKKQMEKRIADLEQQLQAASNKSSTVTPSNTPVKGGSLADSPSDALSSPTAEISRLRARCDELREMIKRKDDVINMQRTTEVRERKAQMRMAEEIDGAQQTAQLHLGAVEAQSRAGLVNHESAIRASIGHLFSMNRAFM